MRNTGYTGQEVLSGHKCCLVMLFTDTQQQWCQTHFECFWQSLSQILQTSCRPSTRQVGTGILPAGLEWDVNVVDSDTCARMDGFKLPPSDVASSCHPRVRASTRPLLEEVRSPMRHGLLPPCVWWWTGWVWGVYREGDKPRTGPVGRMLCTWCGYVIPQSLTPRSRGWRALRSTHGIECRTWISKLQIGASSRMTCVQRSTQTSKTLVQAVLAGIARPAKKSINSFFLNSAVSLTTLAPSSGRKAILWLDFHSHAAPHVLPHASRCSSVPSTSSASPLAPPSSHSAYLSVWPSPRQPWPHRAACAPQWEFWVAGVRLGVSSSPCAAWDWWLCDRERTCQRLGHTGTRRGGSTAPWSHRGWVAVVPRWPTRDRHHNGVSSGMGAVRWFG